MEVSLHLSATHSCGYFDDQQATTMFLAPENEVSTEIYQQLLELGFRRSGTMIYKPHCRSCNKCLSYRIDNKAFEPSRRHKRIIKKNADLVITLNKPHFELEHFDLYKGYLKQRHAGGGMEHHTKREYFESMISSKVNTLFIEFRLHDDLIAVAVTDILENGLSAVYTFFDPKLSRQRSLGSFVILKQIELAQSINKPWSYLGYWIQSCKKMAYKSDYQPAQILRNGEWCNAVELASKR